MSPRLTATLFCTGLGAVAAGLPAAARELHWDALEVTARLDYDGYLHVTERHSMVFDGAWNGGERRFERSSGQTLELHGVRRVDPSTGAVRGLEPGSLDEVDQYDWHDSSTLRWRSRGPSDPPFDQRLLVYEIDYTMGHILRPRGEVYLLDHDFAFPDRAGVIRRFTLDLELDPVWIQPAQLPRQVVREDLRPGRSVVLTAELARGDGAEPAGVHRPPSRALRAAVLGAALAMMLALYLRFRRHEVKVGRFGNGSPARPGDRAWLRENVLDLEPEIAGALWDGRVGPPEVTALIARLVAAGNLRSEVARKERWWQRDVLRLERLREDEALPDYAKSLLRKLFFGGRRTTDTAKMRRHYRSKGFDPAATIRTGIERELMQRGLKPGGRTRRRYAPAVWLSLAIYPLLLLQGPRFPAESVALGLVLTGGVLVCLLLARAGAARWSRRADLGNLASLCFLTPLLGLFLLCGAIAFDLLLPGNVPTPWSLVVLAIAPVALTMGVLERARDLGGEGLEKRRHLAAARAWFREQLRRRSPDLEDAWLPWIIAFGLQRRVDRWFRAFGGAAGATPATRSTLGSGPGSSRGSSWTGGGGSFGGAGATAAWTAAATGMASGVSAASSGGSGSGSSGGGGGGSSGGGGGGGW